MEQWFPLIKLHVQLLNINSMVEVSRLQDHFCMTAVKNSIGEYEAICDGPENSDRWYTKPINNAFLQSVS